MRRHRPAAPIPAAPPPLAAPRPPTRNQAPPRPHTAAPGAPTIAEVRDAKDTALKQAAHDHPLVQAVIKAFPKARIADIKTHADKAQDAMLDALPEVQRRPAKGE